MAREAVGLGLPLLAICRGHQVLNVALGGTLVQHIDEHRFIHHEVRLAPGSPGRGAIGQVAPVGHSVHHQAIDRLGDGLVVSGWAEDGTIEAVELPGRWVARRAVAPGGHGRARRRPAAVVRRLRRRLPATSRPPGDVSALQAARLVVGEHLGVRVPGLVGEVVEQGLVELDAQAGAAGLSGIDHPQTLVRDGARLLVVDFGEGRILAVTPA